MIDLTEASIISSETSSGTLQANELNAIRNFISEVFTNLPSEQYSDLANQAILQIEQKLLVGATTIDKRLGKSQSQSDINRTVLEQAKTIMQQYL